MRDGTVLRADVYRPGGPGSWPVLLSRLPYGKQTPMTTVMLDPAAAAPQPVAGAPARRAGPLRDLHRCAEDLQHVSVYVWMAERRVQPQTHDRR
jgi:predicted acyl esterase